MIATEKRQFGKQESIFQPSPTPSWGLHYKTLLIVFSMQCNKKFPEWGEMIGMANFSIILVKTVAEKIVSFFKMKVDDESFKSQMCKVHRLSNQVIMPQFQSNRTLIVPLKGIRKVLLNRPRDCLPHISHSVICHLKFWVTFSHKISWLSRSLTILTWEPVPFVKIQLIQFLNKARSSETEPFGTDFLKLWNVRFRQSCWRTSPSSGPNEGVDTSG